MVGELVLATFWRQDDGVEVIQVYGGYLPNEEGLTAIRGDAGIARLIRPIPPVVKIVRVRPTFLKVIEG